MKTKICAICGKEFTAYGNQKYCSKECVDFALKKRYKENFVPKQRQKRTCIYCNKIFILNNNGQKYCSKECREKHYTEQINEDIKKRLVKKVCVRCGKEFYTSKSNKKRCDDCLNGVLLTKICTNCGKEFKTTTIRSMFCSRVCYREYHKTFHNRICVICGKEFTTTHKNIQCCSEECREKQRKIQKRETNKIYLPKRYKENINFRLTVLFRSHLRRCLTFAKNYNKMYHTF